MKYLNRNLVELGEQHWGPDPTAGKTSAGDLGVGGRWDHHFSLAGRPHFQRYFPHIILNSLTHHQPLSQVALVKQAASKVTDCVTKIATEHRYHLLWSWKDDWWILICSFFEYQICMGTSFFYPSWMGPRESLRSSNSINFRELHSSVSKVGKAVDRNFVADFDSTAREEVCIASLIWSNI